MKLTALATAFVALLTSLSALAQADAGQTHVAVAANFTEPAQEIAAVFKQKTGDEAVLSFGSTGALYTQITQDAPFEILLSADEARPKKAVDGGFAFPAAASPMRSASSCCGAGRRRDRGEAALKVGNFSKLAIANPAAAPYGTAAIETMKALHLYDALKPKIVQGNNIAQAFQFVDTECRTRLRRAVAIAWGHGGDAVGGSANLYRRSARTRCCSRPAPTARRRKPSSPS